MSAFMFQASTVIWNGIGGVKQGYISEQTLLCLQTKHNRAQ